MENSFDWDWPHRYGLRVHGWRQQQGWSARRLAQEAKCSNTYVQQIEQGTHAPPARRSGLHTALENITGDRPSEHEFLLWTLVSDPDWSYMMKQLAVRVAQSRTVPLLPGHDTDASFTTIFSSVLRAVFGSIPGDGQWDEATALEVAANAKAGDLVDWFLVSTYTFSVGFFNRRDRPAEWFVRGMDRRASLIKSAAPNWDWTGYTEVSVRLRRLRSEKSSSDNSLTFYHFMPDPPLPSDYLVRRSDIFPALPEESDPDQ